MSKIQPRSSTAASTLDGGECSGCGALIYWVEMASGKRMPVDRGADSRVLVENGVGRVVRCYASHFATCPKAERFRK